MSFVSAFRLSAIALAAGLFVACTAVSAAPPTAAYAPPPDSYLADGVDCADPAFPSGGAVELDFGAGGNCTPGVDCDVDVTSNQDGSGSGLTDRTIIGCSVVTLSGEGAAVDVSVVQNG